MSYSCQLDFKGRGKSCPETSETAALRRGIGKASHTQTGSNPSHWFTSSRFYPFRIFADMRHHTPMTPGISIPYLILKYLNWTTIIYSSRFRVEGSWGLIICNVTMWTLHFNLVISRGLNGTINGKILPVVLISEQAGPIIYTVRLALKSACNYGLHIHKYRPVANRPLHNRSSGSDPDIRTEAFAVPKSCTCVPHSQFTNSQFN